MACLSDRSSLNSKPSATCDAAGLEGSDGLATEGERQGSCDAACQTQYYLARAVLWQGVSCLSKLCWQSTSALHRAHLQES